MKRSWLKNLIRKAKSATTEMFNSLEKIMLMMRSTGQSREAFAQQVNSALEDFYQKFQDQAVFVAYFKKHWGSKIGDLLSYVEWLCYPMNYMFVSNFVLLQDCDMIISEYGEHWITPVCFHISCQCQCCLTFEISCC